MQPQQSKITKPIPFVPKPTSRLRMMAETSVRDWHSMSLKRISEGKEPYDLALSNQALGKELGLWPLDRALAPAKAPAQVKPQPKTKAQPAATPAKPKRTPNAVKLLEEDTKEAAAVQKAADAKKTKAPKAEKLKKDAAPELPLGLAKRTSNRAPTLDAAEQFQKAFDFFNSKLFKGELEDTMISWEVNKKANGSFRPDRWAKIKGEPVCHEIVLNPEIHWQRDTTQTLGTLVHEMCHLYVQQTGKGKIKPYHCRIWYKKMLDVGLEPIIVDGKCNPLTDKNGEPKETGKNATHKIDQDGIFLEECNALLATGFDLVWSRIPDPVAPKSDKPKKLKARVKHSCPKCGEFAVAKRDHVLQCTPCKKKMEPDLSDDPEIEGEDE